jgi:hypothetical protein
MLQVDGDRVPPEEHSNLVVICQNIDIIVSRRDQNGEKDLQIPCEPHIKYVRISQAVRRAPLCLQRIHCSGWHARMTKLLASCWTERSRSGSEKTGTRPFQVLVSLYSRGWAAANAVLTWHYSLFQSVNKHALADNDSFSLSPWKRLCQKPVSHVA